MQDDAPSTARRRRNRAVVNDARGYVAELAAKAMDKDLLARRSAPRTRNACARILRGFGALDKDLAYRGSSRAGCAGTAGERRRMPARRTEPLDLRQILASDFWQGPMQFGEFSTMAATMMQPVGGMGRIGQAFGRAS